MKKAIISAIIIFATLMFAALPVCADDSGPYPVIQINTIPVYGDSGGIFDGWVCLSDGTALENPTDYTVVCYLSVTGYDWYVKPYDYAPVTKVNPDGSFRIRTNTGGADAVAPYFTFYLMEKSWTDKNQYPTKNGAESSCVDKINIYRSSDNNISITPDRNITIQTSKKAYNLPEIREDKILVDVDLHTSDYPQRELTEEEIDEYLSTVSSFAYGVRFFSASSSEIQTAYSLAKEKYGLYVIGNAWISANADNSYAECDALIELANEGLCDMCIVGSETLQRNNISESTLIEYISYVRRGVTDGRIAVGTADTIDKFYNSSTLVYSSDVILCNVYPMWEGKGITECPQSFIDAVTGLQDMYFMKDIIISETGYSTDGYKQGNAVMSEENSAAYFSAVNGYAINNDIRIIWFMAADCEWKRIEDTLHGGLEGHFGFLDKSLTLKKAFASVEPFRTAILEYTEDTSGVTVTGLKTKSYAVDIPAEIDGTPVTKIRGSESIKTPAFSGHNETEDIILPDICLEVGNHAMDDTAFFNNPDNWNNGVLYCGRHLIKADSNTISDVSYTLRSDTLDIANYAFCNAGSGSIILNEGLLHIGYAAFEHCSVSEIIIPDSVKTMGEWAFTKSGIITVSIGTGITEIPDHCFDKCEKLSGVFTVPCGINKICDSALIGTGIEQFAVDTDNEFYCAIDGILYDSGVSTLVLCPAGKSGPVLIPETVTSLGYYAFYGCDMINDIYFSGDAPYFRNIANVRGKNIHYLSSSLGWKDDETLTDCSVLPYYRNDLNGDGRENISDSIYLMWSFINTEEYPLPIYALCDYDESGTVNASDAAYLLWNMFYPDEYPV